MPALLHDPALSSCLYHLSLIRVAGPPSGETSTGKLQRLLHIYQSLFIVFLQAAVCKNVNGNWGVYTEGKETHLVCTSNITFIQYIIQASFNLNSGVETQQKSMPGDGALFILEGGEGQIQDTCARMGATTHLKKEKKKKNKEKSHTTKSEHNRTTSTQTQRGWNRKDCG